MAWIESHQEILHHPKTRKLAYSLDITVPTAIGHLHCLWWWAMSYAKDGDLAQYDDVDIAIGAQWMGDPETFVKALVSVGFLDPYSVDDDCKRIHDWDQYGGKWLAKREADADRKRRNREVTGTSTGHPPDIQRTAQVDNIRLDKTTEQRRPPLPPNGTPPSLYAKTLNGALPTLESMFQRIDQLFTPGWLAKELADAEAVVGSLSKEQLGRGLDIAIKQIERQMAAKAVRNPRPFAHKLIVDYLTEQREGNHAT